MFVQDSCCTICSVWGTSCHQIFVFVVLWTLHWCYLCNLSILSNCCSFFRCFFWFGSALTFCGKNKHVAPIWTWLFCFFLSVFPVARSCGFDMFIFECSVILNSPKLSLLFYLSDRLFLSTQSYPYFLSWSYGTKFAMVVREHFLLFPPSFFLPSACMDTTAPMWTYFDLQSTILDHSCVPVERNNIMVGEISPAISPEYWPARP